MTKQFDLTVKMKDLTILIRMCKKIILKMYHIQQKQRCKNLVYDC